MSVIAKETKINEIKKTLTDFMNIIPNVALKKNNFEVIALLCEKINEEVGLFNKHKIDKKDLFIEIYCNFYNLTDEEKATLSKNIDYIINQKIVKDLSYLGAFFLKLWGIIKSKK